MGHVESEYRPNHRLLQILQGSSYLLGQRFSVFVFKFALQRGEGENREGVQISNKAHRTFDPINTLSPVVEYLPFRTTRPVFGSFTWLANPFFYRYLSQPSPERTRERFVRLFIRSATPSHRLFLSRRLDASGNPSGQSHNFGLF